MCRQYRAQLIKRPKKKTAFEIKFDGADAQDLSPLFKLSAELRARICDYVIGSGDLHVEKKPCSKFDVRWTTINRFHPKERRHDGEIRSIARLTALVCSKPDDWSYQYGLSQEPAALPSKFMMYSSNGLYYEKALIPYSRLHEKCLLHHDRNGSSRQNTRVTVQLLQTCRQIYAEAWHLPFINYTFEFPGSSPTLRKDFATRVLFPHQAQAIRSLHIHNLMNPTGPGSFNEILEYFPGLKRLRLDLLSRSWAEHDDPGCKGFGARSPLENVDVIVGYDIGGDDFAAENRVLNREAASAVEKRLQKTVVCENDSAQ